VINITYVILVVLIPILIVSLLFIKFNLKGASRYALLFLALIISGLFLLNQNLKLKVLAVFDQETANIILVDRRIMEFSNSELVTTYLNNHPEVDIYKAFKTIFKDGLKRLEYKDLKKWREIKFKTINNSFSVCSRALAGKISGAELFQETTSLATKDVEQWMDVMIQSATLEMKRAEYFAPSKEEFDMGLKQKVKSLSSEERLRFIETFQLKQRSTPEDLCFCAKVLFQENNNLSPELEEKYLRYLAGKKDASI